LDRIRLDSRRATFEPACFALVGLLAMALLAPAAARGEAISAGAPVVVPIAQDARPPLEAAERLIAQRRWDRALPMLQALLESDTGMVGNGSVYEPLSRYVNRRIASLPAEAREAYELLYDPPARADYEAALAEHSAAALRRTARRYANAPHGRRAALALASLLMDEGEYEAALLVLEGAASGGPGAMPAAAAGARRLLCLARLGRRAEAEALAEALAREGVDRAEVAGREMGLDELVFRASGPASLPAGRPAGRPMLGGRPDGAQPPAALELTRLFPLEFDIPWSERWNPRWPSLPSTRPVATADAVFMNHDGAVLAFDRQRRRGMWAAPRPGAGLYLLGALTAPRDYDFLPLPRYVPLADMHQWRTFDNHGMATLSVAGSRLFAVQTDPLALEFPYKPWTATPAELRLADELRCYDAGTGRLVWRVGAGRGDAFLRDCWFFTAPTVARGRAHVLATRDGRLHALCLEAATGRLVWQRPVGTFAARQEVQRYAMELFLADCSPPSVAGGVAVYPTGQGLVCAYAAHDGSPLWYAPYRRSAQPMLRLGQSVNVPTGPWLPGQALLVDGLCIVAPMDSRLLLALSLGDGTTTWEAEYADGVALLGAEGGRLFVQRRTGAACHDLHSGGRVWRAESGGEAVGLGALGAGAVYLPERGAVRKLDAETGRQSALLAWPPDMANEGNLLLLDDALVVTSPERLSLCLPPAEALAAAEALVCQQPDAPGPAAALAALKAWNGDADAADGLERALGLARRSGDAELLERLRRRSAATLARLAVRTDSAALLDRAGELAAGDARLVGEAARARLAWALADPAGREAPRVYLDLCAEAGMTQSPDGTGTSSLWMQLAAEVRQRCTREPETREAWRRAMTALIEEPGANEAGRLRDVAAWAPLADTRAEALLILGRRWAEAGRQLPARRALAHLLAAHPATEAAEHGRRALRKLLGERLAEHYVSASVEEQARAPLRVPSPEPVWSAPGLLVPPTRPADPARGAVWVLDGPRLRCLDPADGAELWAASLPSTEEARAGPGPGYPSVAARASVAQLAAPSGLYGLGVRSGGLLWRQSLRARVLTEDAIVGTDRLEAILRARRGLATPLVPGVRRFVGGRLFAGAPTSWWAGRNGDIGALDALDGSELLRASLTSGRRTGGVAAAAWGTRLCAAARAPVYIVLFDTLDGRLLAEWRRPRSPAVEDLRVTEGGTLVLASHDGIRTMDLDAAAPLASRAMPAAVEELLYADDEVVVAVAWDGRAFRVSLDGDDPPAALTDTSRGRAVWAGRSGDGFVLLTCSSPASRQHYGPERHVRGAGFVLEAAGEDGWSYAWPGEDEFVMGPPLRCGRLWLMRASSRESVRLAAVDARSGKEAWRVDLPVAGGGPVSLSVVEGRIVVGAGRSVTAFARAAP
jgi:outer membrane protein assembly factor BamB